MIREKKRTQTSVQQKSIPLSEMNKKKKEVSSTILKFRQPSQNIVLPQSIKKPDVFILLAPPHK